MLTWFDYAVVHETPDATQAEIEEWRVAHTPDEKPPVHVKLTLTGEWHKMASAVLGRTSCGRPLGAYGTRDEKLGGALCEICFTVFERHESAKYDEDVVIAKRVAQREQDKRDAEDTEARRREFDHETGTYRKLPPEDDGRDD